MWSPEWVGWLLAELVFGNRYYRGKGEDSAYSYMGQLMGGAQFVTGFYFFLLKQRKYTQILVNLAS